VILRRGTEGRANDLQDNEVRLVGMGNCERAGGESDTRILMHLYNVIRARRLIDGRQGIQS
jgi:hypothetical protein